MGGSKIQYTLALSLLKEVCRDETENFVISPLSLGMALAMLTAGLRGKTQTELLQLFGATDEKEIHSMYSALLSEKDHPLEMANKVSFRFCIEECPLDEATSSRSQPVTR